MCHGNFLIFLANIWSEMFGQKNLFYCFMSTSHTRVFKAFTFILGKEKSLTVAKDITLKMSIYTEVQAIVL